MCQNFEDVDKWPFINLVRRAIDFLTVVLSFALGFWFYLANPQHSVPYTFLAFLVFGVIAGAVFVMVFQSVRLYEREVSLLNVVETKRQVQASVFASLIVVGLTFYVRVLDLSREMVTASLVFTFLLLLVERSLFYRLSIALHLRGRAIRPVLIYGAGIVGRHLFKRIYHSPGLGIHVAGFLDDDIKLWDQEVRIAEVSPRAIKKVLGGLDQLETLIPKLELREVFLALPTATYQRNLEIAQECARLGLSVSIVPPTFGRQMHALEVTDIGGIPVIREKSLKTRFIYPVLKRIFDLSVASASIVLLSPLMAAIALAIKLDSPGPIVFRQRRVGQGGKEFDFFKFRSMHVSANPYGLTPREHTDPRITKFGRWLRRSSLDEIPQFFNVIKGEMSIVGPRPEMPFIVATYNEEQKERLKVKPGITGVWQISAVRGEPIHANMEYDLFYIEHRSFTLDVIIMIKTIATAIRGIGAV